MHLEPTKWHGCARCLSTRFYLLLVFYFLFLAFNNNNVEAAFGVSSRSFVALGGFRPIRPKPRPLFPSFTLQAVNIGDEAPPASRHIDNPPFLTVIFPAYNESLRIGATLRDYHGYLAASNVWQDSSQILVVDDGSLDETADVVLEFSKQVDNKDNSTVSVNCISLPQNQGKGAALAFGIDHVAHTTTRASNIVLLADADGSADIACLEEMLTGLRQLVQEEPTSRDATISTATTVYNWNRPALVVGRRLQPTTSIDRAILRWGFRTCVFLTMGDLGVSDTQCGFKLLTLPAAQLLYSNLHLQGWSHDVEVLYRAKLVNISVVETAIDWQDKEGSKLVTSAGGTVGASLKMLLEITPIRIWYATGRWK